MSLGGLENYLLPVVATVGFAAVAITVFFSTRSRGLFEDILKSEKEAETEKAEAKPTEKATIPVANPPSLMFENVEGVKGDLRVMDVEKEIVGYALTRLYEAEAEGRITPQDRTQMLGKYEREMQRLDKEIEKKQMIVKLHDLEETKASLVAMFHDKLDEISRNIEGIRTALGIAPLESAQVKEQPPQQAQPAEASPETASAKEKKSRERPAPKPRVKSKTEERIEAVQGEVMKVLERLEQIEIEEEHVEGDAGGRGESEKEGSAGSS